MYVLKHHRSFTIHTVMVLLVKFKLKRSFMQHLWLSTKFAEMFHINWD